MPRRTATAVQFGPQRVLTRCADVSSISMSRSLHYRTPATLGRAMRAVAAPSSLVALRALACSPGAPRGGAPSVIAPSTVGLRRRRLLPRRPHPLGLRRQRRPVVSIPMGESPGHARRQRSPRADSDQHRRPPTASPRDDIPGWNRSLTRRTLALLGRKSRRLARGARRRQRARRPTPRSRTLSVRRCGSA